jgi:hypothetical protein
MEIQGGGLHQEPPEEHLRLIFQAAAHLFAVGISIDELGRRVALQVVRQHPEVAAWFAEHLPGYSDAREAIEHEGRRHGWWRMVSDFNGTAEAG